MLEKSNSYPDFVLLLRSVSNAWPERGASSMKHIKSRLRSSLKSDLLNALMQVAVNGPPVLESLPIVETAVKNWLGRKTEEKQRMQLLQAT